MITRIGDIFLDIAKIDFLGEIYTHQEYGYCFDVHIFGRWKKITFLNAEECVLDLTKIITRLKDLHLIVE